MPEASWTSAREQMGYPDCPVSFMYCPWPLYAYCTLGPPTRRFGRWSIDFMTNLPLCNGNNTVMTCIEGLLGYVRLIPCFMGEGELSAEHVAQLFFDSVV